MRKAKKVSDSSIEMREMVMPNHTNPQNTIFGGVIMSWVDIAAAMCAAKHAGAPVVTAHISDIDFLVPIKIGSHVIIKASMNYVGRSSMVVGVQVLSENPYTGEQRKTTKAYLTFVALDEFGKAIEVPTLELSNSEEERRFENAKARIEIKKQMRSKLK